VISEDDRSDPKDAATLANKLVNNKEVLAVIGHYNSSCTLAAAPIYNRAKVLELSPGSTAPAVSKAGAYTARVIVTDAAQGEFVAHWMVKDKGYKRIAVLFENDDYGLGLKDVLAAKIPANGGQVVAVESYYLGETKDFNPIITKIRALKPDAVFIGGLYNEAALIAKQASDVGWNPPIFGVDGLYSPALATLGGKSVEGICFSGFFHPAATIPMVQEYVKAYRARFKAEPGTYDAFAYDAMLVIAKAIENGGADRQAIQKQLKTIKVEGVTGTNIFDEHGDVRKNPMKLTIKGGQIVPSRS
jgi:branched-chain amino acid transport system substrate-binding protein